MDNNVKIVLGNGDTLDAVGISFIHIDASNKDYIFYSLNELANGNMDKIYIAEASQNGTTPGPISDDEWANIKQIMLNISHNEAVNGISYKPLIGLSFNVGEAKKLAIKGDKKQAFIDAQNKAVAPTTEIDEPAFVSDQAANGSPFFASDVSATGQVEQKVEEEQVQSAFAMQPPVQQESPVESLDTETPQQVVAPQAVPAPVEETPAVSQPEEPAVAPTPVVETVSQTVEAVPTPVQPEIVTTPVVEEPAIPVNTVAVPTNDLSTMSVDELKQAVIEAQTAINKINSYLNSLDNKPEVKTVTVDTVQTQVVSTGVSPVSTENMVVADQPEIKTDSLEEELQLTNPIQTVQTVQTVPVQTAPVAPAPEVIQAVAPTAPVADSTLIDTSVPVTGEVLNTSVQTNVEESVVPIAIEPLESTTEEVGEPAFAINDGLDQPQTIVLDTAVAPQATPNSAQDINSTSVQVAIPEAPVVENVAPVIPIPPSEENGIPDAQPIPTVAPVPAAPAVQPGIISNVVPVEPVPTEAPQNVESVPEINVAPVQQVPTVDLSAINTDVVLPTDMASNPNPGTISQGVLGPATLDVNDQAA